MSLLKTNEIQNYNGSSLTLTASTVSTSAQLNTGGNISVTGSLNVSDDSTTRTNLGLGSMATQNANAVTITGGTINTVQPETGQSLTIKDEDGNTAIIIGTDNTAASYLSLNFGSYHGDSGGVGLGTRSSNTLSDYEKGSWTPVYEGASGTAGAGAPAAIYGFYEKIGNLVFVVGAIEGSRNTLTGNIKITGLPFTVNNLSSDVYSGGLTVGRARLFQSDMNLQLLLSEDSDEIILWKNLTNVSSSAVVSGDLSTNSQYNEIYFSGCYLSI
jgi:hypothetical protein